jgi:hypothetical protein
MSLRDRAVALFSTFVVLQLGLAGCSKSPSSSSGNGEAAVKVHVGAPLTDQECSKFAMSLKEAIDARNVAEANNLVDWDALLETGMAGVETTDSCRKNFAKGFKNATGHGGLFGHIVESVKGGSYKMLRIHTVKDEKRVLFRLMDPAGAFSYHDWILARRPNGQVRAVDVYIFASGERMTETARRGFLPVAAQASQGVISRLVGGESDYVKNWPKLKQMADCLKTQKYKDGLAVYQQLPSSMKKDKNTLIIRFNLAQNSGDEEEYSKAMQDIMTNYPNDPCADFIGIDAYLLRNEYTKRLFQKPGFSKTGRWKGSHTPLIFRASNGSSSSHCCRRLGRAGDPEKPTSVRSSTRCYI